MVWQRWFQLGTFAQTCGLIQDFSFLLLPRYKYENAFQAWDTNWNVWFFLKLLHLWFNHIGKRGPVGTIVLPLGFPWDDWLISDSVANDDGNWWNIHDVLIDKLQPQDYKLGMLSLSVIWLVRVAEPLFRMCRSFLMIQSVISWPRASVI